MDSHRVPAIVHSHGQVAVLSFLFVLLAGALARRFAAVGADTILDRSPTKLTRRISTLQTRLLSLVERALAHRSKQVTFLKVGQAQSYATVTPSVTEGSIRTPRAAAPLGLREIVCNTHPTCWLTSQVVGTELR